jgi:glycosyltransferase involved in cell wall biosynthesis
MNNLIAREGEADGIFIHSIKACSSLRSFNHPKKVTILHAIKSEMLAKHSGIALYIRRNAIRKTYTNSIIVAVSWEIKKDFMLSYNIPSERIHIIHNGIDTHAIKKKAKTYSPPVKAPYLVYIGRMEKIKGPDILLTAFMSIKRNDLKLVFIGGGSLLNHLKERALNAEGKTIIFTGPLENPMPYLQKATYSVMPSRSEGLGMSALESLALETPVIASDLDVFSEFESEGLLFFKTENHEDLTKKIEELALNRPMPAQLSKKFDIALSAKNYLNIIS